ncbi:MULTISPECIES: hypothetical protein [Clostridium]|jgi:heme/copper-type cytochrome/quinol oxidase subunit 2|uniref:Uncharacterized protein n=1 Tax=bioreactor metagenome TaxID=1076179 RepID=A0A644ZYM3_9ZZZZ|nr:hypothetical protein [Clostridium sp. C8]KLE16017.1 hypothetical protein AAT22_08270 [Clostridium sp. C8]
MDNKGIKSILIKISFITGIILLICFFGGLVYLRYDYYTNSSPYASTPLSVYNIIHGIIFLIPSIICFVIAMLLNSKTKK